MTTTTTTTTRSTQKKDLFYYSDSVVALTNCHTYGGPPQRRKSPARLNFNEFSHIFYHHGGQYHDDGLSPMSRGVLKGHPTGSSGYSSSSSSQTTICSSLPKTNIITTKKSGGGGEDEDDDDDVKNFEDWKSNYNKKLLEDNYYQDDCGWCIVGDVNDSNTNNLSRWTPPIRRVRKEDVGGNKLLPNLFTNYFNHNGTNNNSSDDDNKKGSQDKRIGGGGGGSNNKSYYQCINCFNHNIDINGDNDYDGHEACDKNIISTSQPQQQKEFNNHSSGTDNTGKIINLSILGRRRGVLRTMSENNADFEHDHHHQKQEECLIVKSKSVSFNSSTKLYFERQRRKDEIDGDDDDDDGDDSSSVRTKLTDLSIISWNKMDKNKSSDNSSSEPTSLSGDEESSSSTYSTAEEDHLESDIENRTSVTSQLSDYATPDTSLTNVNVFTFDGDSRHRHQSSSRMKSQDVETGFAAAAAAAGKEEEDDEVDQLNDTIIKIDGDFENTLTEANFKSPNCVRKYDNDFDKHPHNHHQSSHAKELNNTTTTAAAADTSSLQKQPHGGQGRGHEIVDVVLVQNRPVMVQDLQTVFNFFKQPTLSITDCESLLESLGQAQRRSDFQWALHQLGGFNALLFLYARVAEICPHDALQAKSLSLVLTQLQNHARLTDGPPHRQYHLIRFVLNSEKCTFGFKTFIQIINFCLSASGLKLIDYQLLDTLLLSSWKILTRVRCKEADAPTGPKSLFECLLTIVLDLLEERNPHRDLNLTLLKVNGFTQTLLAICYHLIIDEHTILNPMDATRLATLVKSILDEIMAPPDAHVAVTLVKFGLYPLLPRELPPLPRKADAFFILQQNQQPRKSSRSSSSTSSMLDLNHANVQEEAEEANEADRVIIGSSLSVRTTTTTITISEPRTEPEEKMVKDQAEEEVVGKGGDAKKQILGVGEDVPEIVGIFNASNLKNGTKKITSTQHPSTSTSDGNNFAKIFQESLLEGVMSILLNALSILPDASFQTVLNPHLNSHLFVAYCSHSSVSLKKLALKLLSAYLSRVKNPVVLEFLKRKGFFLTSLYVQGTPEVSQLIVDICNGFGPLSYPLVIALLYSNTVVNSVIDWVLQQQQNESIIPALMTMGLLPSIFNIQAQSRHSKLQKPLQNLLSIVTRFCALHPKEESWKNLLCPSIELAYGHSPLVPRIMQEATEFLRRNSKKKDLKKVVSNTRLLWLLERACAAGKMGTHFDKWLLNIFTLHIMEMDEDDEMENWIYFVKKNKKKLNQLMGIFLCRIFANSTTNNNSSSNNHKDLDFKHHTIRVLLTFCPHLTTWLPKVVKYDETMERCFTAFVRIFLSTAEQKCVNINSSLKTPSFHSLISDNGNLTLTLQMGTTNNTLSNDVTNPVSGTTTTTMTTENVVTIENIISEVTHQQQQQQQDQAEDGCCDDVAVDPMGPIQLSDRTVRTKFEAVLVDVGILSPSNNFSTFSADFKNFKILLETPTSCISPMELRQCLCSLEKMKTPFLMGPDNNRLSHPSGGVSAGSNKHHHQHGVASCCSFFEIFESVHQYAMEMLFHVARARTRQEVDVARRICLQDADVDTVKQWINVMEQMVHPKAPWHFPDSYPSFCALDQSEGPGRVRTRLKREHLRVHSRFVMPEYRISGSSSPPLEYLFLSCSAELKVPLILNEIQYMRFCTRIIPGEELPGEIILTKDHLTFIAEHANFQTENVEVRKTAIKYLMKRRYTLEDRAVEIFLECRSFLFVFKTKKDREEFVSLLALKHSANSHAVQFHSVNSTLMETSMTSMTSQWLKGHLSNFEYLMYLNTAAGRTYCDLMQYPVFPFVLSKYNSPTLDLWAPQSYRDLKKPMAIQDSSKEEHFISTYNYLKRECDSAPFHYGSHYSNSGIVLHFLVRLPPYTQHFLKYQDGSFDIPDRSFHSLETTWRLASKESNTDFKEAIPEFFYLPELFQNLQHFDLGLRQNGQRVEDVVLPPWAKGDARLFTLVNRQALESNHVRKYLCDWIDLIFGYKQTGKAALQALNIFHPSTYEGFEVDGSGDELLIKARKAMVSTYGQTPKQLFAYPHPRPSLIPEEKCEMEVLDTVWGLRWGFFIGSPACPDLEVIHTREYQERINLFETNSRVVFWPEHTLILGDSVVGYWDANSIRVKSKIVFNAIGDDITVCVGTTSSIWCGHQSGRISVLKMSPQMDTPQVLEKVELVGHYQPIKNIHVNQEFSMAISCAGENYAIVWDTNKYPNPSLLGLVDTYILNGDSSTSLAPRMHRESPFKIIAFNNAIDCPETVDNIYSSSSTGDIVLLNKRNNRVTLATINGSIVGTIVVDERIESVCLSGLDPGRNVNVIAIGCDYGVIRFYSSWDLKFLNQLKVLPLASLPIKSLRYSRQGHRLYCLSQMEDGAVTVSLSLTNAGPI